MIIIAKIISSTWFDKPVLSEPFILREPQDERGVEGLTMTGIKSMISS